MSSKKTMSLAELNLQQSCETSMEMEILTKGGKSTGVFLSVLGGESQIVKNWVNKELNARRRAEFIQTKRGKIVEVRPVEDDIDFGVELVAIRIVGWRGITEPYSPENALLLCSTNAEILNQVREFSEDTENFTKG